MKLVTESTLHGMIPLTAVSITAGLLCLGGKHEDPAPCDRPPLAATGINVGVKQAGRYRFTQADIPVVVTAMQNAGITSFICWIDPTTGTLDVETGPQDKPHLDMKPGSCPNPVEVDQAAFALAGEVPGGVLGNAFDVTQIDVGSIRLSPVQLTAAPGAAQEISPIHTNFEDVGTPFVGVGCECAALGPDGALDIIAQYDRAEMIEAFELDTVPDGTFVPLKVTGMLTEGRAIFGTRDCIRVINH